MKQTPDPQQEINQKMVTSAMNRPFGAYKITPKAWLQHILVITRCIPSKGEKKEIRIKLKRKQFQSPIQSSKYHLHSLDRKDPGIDRTVRRRRPYTLPSRRNRKATINYHNSSDSHRREEKERVKNRTSE